MMGVPKGLDLDAIRQAIATHPGVAGVHDLHVWALGSNQPALSAHVVVDPSGDHAAVKQGLDAMLDETFEIEHTTLQLETDSDGVRCEVPAHP